MKQYAPLVAIGSALAALFGFVHLWAKQAGIQGLYIYDYARLTLGIPSFPAWRYRIETVQHMPIAVIPQIYGYQPLYSVLLYPLAAAFLVCVLSLFTVAALSGGAVFPQGRVLRGPKVISNWAWKWRLMGKKKGFYIAQ